jgi:hypothetical protein
MSKALATASKIVPTRAVHRATIENGIPRHRRDAITKSENTPEAERSFNDITTRFLAAPAVAQGTGFGSSPGLNMRGKIFAMLVWGELVVKLPKQRVDQLVDSNTGTRFERGQGRPLKE